MVSQVPAEPPWAASAARIPPASLAANTDSRPAARAAVVSRHSSRSVSMILVS